MEKTKMVMTEKLANELMNNLACLAMSALGTEEHIVAWEKDGEENVPIFSDEYIREVMDYAKSEFLEICGKWEQKMGEEFVVLPPDDEEEVD